MSNTAIDLETLQLRYQTLLNSYQSLVTEFKNTYATDTNTLLDKAENSKFETASNDLNSLAVRSIQECVRSCSSNRLCTGATYNSSNRMCYLKQGPGTIMAAGNIYSSIAPKSKILLYNIQTMNSELININRQIKTALNNSSLNNTGDNQKKLRNKYNRLMSDRDEINKYMKEYESLDSTYNNDVIQSTQNYYIYVLLCVLAIICVWLVFKLSLPNIKLDNTWLNNSWLNMNIPWF
jgi:NADH:ubiquinone oxidoreductase subunit 3 (subunit A)